MKKGFTLSEVIITLGIVGLISALTLPSLTKNGQNTANATKLQKCVQNVEQLFTVMIAKENAEDLFETKAWKYAESNNANFLKSLQSYLLIGYDEDGATDLYDNASIYLLSNDGSFVFIKNYKKANSGQKNISDMLKLETSLNAKAADVYIDVNGKKSPNTAGRDLFHFYLGSDGVLYADGSKDFIAYLLDKEGNNWNGTENAYM